MVDGHGTTQEWQAHAGAVCVLPVGSFEQHGRHLPLSTDILCAEHFGRALAEDLDAALLPALPIGTCGEHTGFRGSISLRPETLMRIVRDVADEIERQQFRVLVLLNGHGGNFALGPVVRDINRRDRPLKLLLVDWWDHAPPEALLDNRGPLPDLHAGEMETSVLLAIHPDLVRLDAIEPPADVSPEGGAMFLRQRDLNTFGVGHFDAGGVVGYPSLASAEKGRQIVGGVRGRLLAHVRDRLQLLANVPRYAGAGGIAVRPMAAEDVAAGMRLKSQAGWNQTEEDWRRFLEGPPGSGGFAAVHNGRVVGTAAAIRYGDDLGWIGMMLVDAAFRRQGIGRLLLQHAVDHLSGCRAVKLDATPEGESLYEGLGFGGESRLHRLTHPCLPAAASAGTGDAGAGILPIADDLWPGLLALDRSCFGADRGRLLRALAADDPARALCLVARSGRAGAIDGFCFGRRGANFHQIGPLVAATPGDAVRLAQAAMHGLRGRPVVLDVPEARGEFVDWLSGLGFARQRPFLRMARPSPLAASHAAPPQQGERVFAICGPELG